MEIINILIVNNANINIANQIGDTPLMWAARKGHLSVVKLLVASGANINIANHFIGDTPLLLATKNNHLTVVNMLLKHNINFNHTNKFGFNVLLYAAENGYLDVIKVLLVSGVDVNHVNQVNDTALIWAVRKGYLDVVKVLLVSGADVNHVNQIGYTTLLIAAENGYLDIVNKLLTNNADVNHVNQFADSALILAINKGYLSIVNALLANNVDVNHANRDGITALMIAAEKGHVETFHVLIENNADMNYVNQFGDTALIIANRNNHIEIETIINQVSSLKNKNLLNSKKIRDKIICILINRRNWDYPKKIEAKIFNLIYKSEFYFNKKFKNISLKLKQLLKKEFISKLIFDEENYRILHIAVLNNCPDLLAYLINNWAIDIELKDKSGNTAWNYACLLLQIENALAIKKEWQLTDENIKFLKENINLLTRKAYNIITTFNTKDSCDNDNRLNILKYYNILDNSEELFKQEVNSIELQNQQSITNTYQLSSLKI